MAISVDADPKDASLESEEVFLLGEGPYDFYFPKVGALLSKLRRAGNESANDNEKGEAYWNLQLEWLERGFGEDVFAEIITDRLEDEDDELEENHVSELFKLLLKAASGGRPTTSSKGSSRSASARKPKAARSRKDSDSETSTSESSAT